MLKKMQVKGMHCQACERLLTLNINELEGVTVQSISHKNGEVVVDCKGAEKLEEIKRIIEESGYTLAEY